MKTLFRAAATIISAISTHYFVFWVGGAILDAIKVPLPFSMLGALLVAIAVARFVWTQTASFQAGLGSSILLGAVVLGAIGFSAGFFGPMWLTPDANQGPLLGIFMTGPIGFLLGGLLGGIYWVSGMRKRND